MGAMINTSYLHLKEDCKRWWGAHIPCIHNHFEFVKCKV